MNVNDDNKLENVQRSLVLFLTVTELNKKPKERQAGALCRVMGINCVKVMNSRNTLIGLY